MSGGVDSESGRPRVRGRDKMEMGSIITGKHLRSRAGAWARAREAFFDPAIGNETDSAVDFAMEKTEGNPRYRNIWRYYCLHIGLNTFLDQLFTVISSYEQGEIRQPARAFHARIRAMKTQIDEVEKLRGGEVEKLRGRFSSSASSSSRKVGEMSWRKEGEVENER